jgi:hypothetical protein
VKGAERENVERFRRSKREICFGAFSPPTRRARALARQVGAREKKGVEHHFENSDEMRTINPRKIHEAPQAFENRPLIRRGQTCPDKFSHTSEIAQSLIAL